MRLAKDGLTVDVDDSDRLRIDYYLGEGFTADDAAPPAEVVSFPRIFDGERYVDGPGPVEVEQLPDGQHAQLPDGPVEVAGDGKQKVGVEHPADGTLSPEISNP